MLQSDCFGDALRITQDKLDGKNFYAFNPSYKADRTDARKNLDCNG